MRTNVDLLIIGAGAGGLGAAVQAKHLGIDFMVVEGNESLPLNLHNGVHYLHSVPELPFKSEFKEMTLTDGILFDGEIHHTPNLKWSLLYSEKVREIQHPSSIMDVGKTTKVYMPKSNTVNTMLTDMYDFADHDNFSFGLYLSAVDVHAKTARFNDKNGEIVFVDFKHLITTVPLDKFRAMLPKNEHIHGLTLGYSPVYITNYKVNRIVPNWMINLYIPTLYDPIYRASILNGICSVESIRELSELEQEGVRGTLRMFHLDKSEPTKYTWNTGKVLSISNDDRDLLDTELGKMSISAVGRFARWDRKLLIDTTIEQARKVVDKLNIK